MNQGEPNQDPSSLADDSPGTVLGGLKADVESASTEELEAAAAIYARIANPPTLAQLQKDIWEWTKAKGWADDEAMGRTTGDLLMLMVCEIAEAYEEHRKWHSPTEIYVHAGKPEGIPIELADCVIRILSFAAKHDIDLQQAVLDKMAYNETREFRHGGKRA